MLCMVALLALAACSVPGLGAPAAAVATATATDIPTATATATDIPTPTHPPVTPGVSVATIAMGINTFSGNVNVTIKAGQAVTFDDPASGGGVHPLVTGTHGEYTEEPGAPSDFNTQDGVLFSPGTKMAVTFPNPGTFHITCVAHPVMQVTITVKP
jgi:plastocyanin